MTDSHLWAIGFDDVARAEQVRDEVKKLAWGPGRAGKHFLLLDAVVVVRHSDGTFTIDREPFRGVANILACTAAGFLAGLAIAVPLSGATLGAVVGGVGTAASAAAAGLDEEFLREVERMMKPGSSALFVLDDAGEMEVILHEIRGLGGTVLKTNADQERARLIQSTLAARAGDSDPRLVNDGQE
jgi:uncharacterized membrane protein